VRATVLFGECSFAVPIALPILAHIRVTVGVGERAFAVLLALPILTHIRATVGEGERALAVPIALPILTHIRVTVGVGERALAVLLVVLPLALVLATVGKGECALAVLITVRVLVAIVLAPLRVGGGGAREWGSCCSFPKISLIILRWPFYDVDLCIALKFAIKVYPAVAIRQLHSEMDPSPGPPKCLTKYRLCKVCGRPLVKIGTARANGAQHHGDWWGRATHKQCFKAMQPKRRKKGGKRPTFRVACKHKRFF
jgi:hypothetical protein